MNKKISRLLTKMAAYEKQWDAKFAVDKATGLFLYELVLQKKPELVLELGTWRGASAIYLAAALQENKSGSLITVDRGNDRVQDAKKNFQESGLDGLIDFQVKEIDVFFKEDKHEYDLVFMDASKQEQGGWLKILLEKHVHPGTIIVIDDVITMGDRMQDLFAFVNTSSRLSQKIEEIDDGLLVLEVLN